MVSLLLDYLNELSSLDELYSNPWTCQAIFRSLPPLAQQYIMRLLYIGDKDVSTNILKKWINYKDSQVKQQHITSLKRMLSLKIITEETKKYEVYSESRQRYRTSTRSFIKLNPIFRVQMKIAIENSCPSPWSSSSLQPDKNPPSKELLQNFSRRQWDAVLDKLFGGNSDVVTIKGIIELFEQTGLMQKEGNLLVLGTLGYQFLFYDPFTQIWILLRAHLTHSEHKIELLSFLFQLSFLTVGKDYAMVSLTPAQTEFVKLLTEFGLIYRSTRGSRRYYPTYLAVNLISGKAAMKQDGFIVAETNHQIYAYCKSKLTVKVLSLFTEMKCRLPNLVIGKITRTSIREAFAKGILADLIIEYLIQNTHGETRKLEYPIPETLIHQIKLWEKEENAVQVDEGVLYERFNSHEEYELLKKWALELDILLWCNDSTKLFFVKAGGEQLLTNYANSK